MNFIDFRKEMFDLACFSTHQVYAWDPDFSRNNFVRWTKMGYLIQLRNGLYTFPEYQSKPDYALYFANRIYRPSYISLHSALAFYGMIPEGVFQFTSVTTLKTKAFSNLLGEYIYKSIHPDLMFGYALKPFSEGRTLQIASPEKAVLDLLYLYPMYNTESDFEELRLDRDFMKEEFDRSLLDDYSLKFGNKALTNRVNTLKQTYDL